MPSIVDKLIRDEIKALSAYHVPPAVGMVKLDAMENPFSWSDALKSLWLEKLRTVSINRYPDPNAQSVKESLRLLMGIDEQYELMLGNGSDEIIQILAMAVAKPDRVVMAPEPSFVMYKMIATFVGMQYVGVPLNEAFELDLDATLSAIEEHQPALIFLAQPNNPTGTLYSRAQILAIIEAAQGLVVIDEAYMAFTDSDYLDVLDSYENVVVMRTLSKVGLAGLRLGVLIGAPAWVSQFEKMRLPYNINVLTQASVEFALAHYEVLQQQTALLREQRKILAEELEASVPHQRIWPSEANFILIRMEQGQARPIFEKLKATGILVKCLDGGHPALTDCLRLTVGSPDENQRMLDALKAVIAS